MIGKPASPNHKAALGHQLNQGFRTPEGRRADGSGARMDRRERRWEMVEKEKCEDRSQAKVAVCLPFIHEHRDLVRSKRLTLFFFPL